nr:putative RING-H2 finger protein ATL21A [Quercus suber]
MASFHIFFSISFLILFFLCHIATSRNFCQTSSCGDNNFIPIKFPFQLNTTQTKGCGYPGFNLSCNTKSQTILTLPYSGDFIVREIDYFSQSLVITDPDHCLPERYLKNFTLLDSPFQILSTGNNFTFYNCSSNVTLLGFGLFGPIDCVKNSENYSVWMSPSFHDGDMVPASCSVLLNNTMLPLLAPWVELVWSQPNCEVCGGDCVLASDSDLKVGCYNYNVQSRSGGSSSGTVAGLPRSAKYGIIIGVGIPGLLCFIGLGCFICGRIRVYARRRHPNTQLSTSSAPHQSVVLMGLDGPTIESFPKILLGESKRLPKPNDNTCPICLSEYQAKETLRTIPECNHYFHANCIDEWLKMNATCPLCRNSPDQSTLISPSSSLSSSSSSLLSS